MSSRYKGHRTNTTTTRTPIRAHLGSGGLDMSADTHQCGQCSDAEVRVLQKQQIWEVSLPEKNRHLE